MIVDTNWLRDWLHGREVRAADRKAARRRRRVVFAWLPVPLVHDLANEQRFCKYNHPSGLWAWLQPVVRIEAEWKRFETSRVYEKKIIYKRLRPEDRV